MPRKTTRENDADTHTHDWRGDGWRCMGPDGCGAWHPASPRSLAELQSRIADLLAAFDAASGPRAHRVGCECPAVECANLRNATQRARG